MCEYLIQGIRRVWGILGLHILVCKWWPIHLPLQPYRCWSFLHWFHLIFYHRASEYGTPFPFRLPSIGEVPNVIMWLYCYITSTPSWMLLTGSVNEVLPVSDPRKAETRWVFPVPLSKTVSFLGAPLFSPPVNHWAWVPSLTDKTCTVTMSGFVHIYYAVPTTTFDTFPDPSLFPHLIPQNQPVPGFIPHPLTLLLCSIQSIVCPRMLLLLPMK